MGRGCARDGRRPPVAGGLRARFAAHGRPVAYYSDRYGVFRVNRRDREGEPTQFARAPRTLDVESIHAGSPQAKGRVERANLTLQDRLVKEMRLRGICGIEEGNAYLPAFMADYNRRFGVAPRNPADAHRPVLRDERELDLILRPQHPRKVTRNLSISFEGRTCRSLRSLRPSTGTAGVASRTTSQTRAQGAGLSLVSPEPGPLWCPRFEFRGPRTARGRRGERGRTARRRGHL